MRKLNRTRQVVVAAMISLICSVLLAPELEAQVPESRYFPETEQTVKGAFWKYWQERGGLPQQGFPISAELQEKSDLDGKTYTVQYFERAVFEWHPENKPPYDVLLSQLGTFRYKQKYPNGAPGQKPNLDAGTMLFPETGKRLGGSFLAHWTKSGGIAQQGFPISDEFEEKSDLDGKTYTVQYFERAVFEWHPDNKPPHNVLLSQLGTFRHRVLYKPSSQPIAPMRDWIAPVNVSRSGGTYDNQPSIVGSPQTGEVSIAWEQRDEGRGASNTLLTSFNDPGGEFRPQVLHSAGYRQLANVKIKRDALGRRHVVWWVQTGATVCTHYARVEIDGMRSVLETVPGTCGQHFKLTGLALGPDSTVHALFGRDNGGLFYYRRVESGAWTVQGEVVAPAQVSAMVSIAVGTSGAVMAAYRTGGNNFESDIYVGVRGGDGRWAMENISSNCCTGCPAQAYSYMPALAADPSGSGGIRLLWADEQCEPRTDPRQNDLYYREWLPGGGWTGPPARIVRDPGDAYENSLVVDSTGVSHIVFAADAGTRSHGNYRLFYVSGRGDKFSAPVGLFPGWGREATFHKSPALDYSNGWLHLAFDSDHEGSKEVYYSNKGLGR